MAKEHSQNPANYLQTCQLCCDYVNACENEPGARCFWEEHLEYLHFVANKVSILHDPYALTGSFQVQVKDMNCMDQIFNAFDDINPEEISTSIAEDIVTCHIYEPDILWYFQ